MSILSKVAETLDQVNALTRAVSFNVIKDCHNGVDAIDV